MASKRNYYGNIRAPNFPEGLEWINTAHPLSLVELRGKLVLLDFWTYGCINCIHIIPDLKRLEAMYPNELVVIGVHSAKFANERESDNLRQIVERYGIEHPVVNDRDFTIWQSYAVHAWPTSVLIDPRGRVLAAHSGEGVFEAYAELIADAVRQYDQEGVLDDSPLDIAPDGVVLEERPAAARALSFPGKVLADETSGRLFIADSNHHRIVICDLAGTVQEVIGAGSAGLEDGVFEEARLNKPQGMALDGDQLYIADTENHAIRRADLAARTLLTVAGDGTQGRGSLGGDPRNVQLNSPWDLVLVGGYLFIAMAGPHQLWVLDIKENRLVPYAGSGREALLDGPLVHAGLAQPSGITSDGRVLYFADSEASAIRQADLDTNGVVRTLIGQGLFEFGDVDGDWQTARLQHPLGVLWYQSTLYVADTYNHKLKVVDAVAGRASTYLGDGHPGHRDGAQPRFYEPAGLAGAGGKLYVADTNNHAVRVVDLESRTVETLELEDPRGLLPVQAQAPFGGTIRLPAQQVRPGQGVLRVELRLPKGYKVNDTAPSRLVWENVADGAVALSDEERTLVLNQHDGRLHTKATFEEGQAVVRGDLALYYCAEENANVCLIKLARVEVPIAVEPGAPASDVDVVLTVAV
ncbi:MAG: thioredoxin-like domain-containing protein [Anaerolineae bacterium]